MRIEKKIWQDSFNRILEGVKTYELRLADFECNPGDVLVLREWDPKTKEYTGRVIEKQVTYVGKTKNVPYWTKKEIDEHGFQIISFK
jgi:ribosomal protein S17